MAPSISQKTVSMTFFTDCYSRNIFFTTESVFSLHGLSFQLWLEVAQPYLVHLSIFFWRKRVSLNSSHILLLISHGLHFQANTTLMRDLCLFVATSYQTQLDTRSKTWRPIKVGIKGRGRSGTSRDSNHAGLCCSLAHLVQCEPDEASSFMKPNVGPGTYAGLWLELDSKV